MRKTKRIEPLADEFEMTKLDIDVINIIEKAEKFVLLWTHLSKLNSTSQQIMNLYFLKHSTQEIAKILGLSKQFVKKRKYEIKKELIESIQNDLRFQELK